MFSHIIAQHVKLCNVHTSSVNFIEVLKSIAQRYDDVQVVRNVAVHAASVAENEVMA